MNYSAFLKLNNLITLSSKYIIYTQNKRFLRATYSLNKDNFRAICALNSRYFHTNIVLSKRRKSAEERKSNKILEYSPKSKAEVVAVWRDITLAELAKILGSDIQHVKDLFLNKYSSPNSVISDVKELQQGIRRGGKRMTIIGKPTNELEAKIIKDITPRPPPSKEMLKPRPPVVTVMGHVDHGKTTLLDALRNANVVDKEFGGITQHIGAFSVTLDSGAKITFLDTPGHAAFSSMRARGANLTDIVVLVVAADDGVMEQTIESIKMAKNARVPILVAINKIDSPKADIKRTETMLIEVGLQPESMGGDVQAIPISALKKTNLKELVEAIIVQAEMLEIGGDPTGPVEGIVVESKSHQHRGKLCTVVVQRGTLKKGDILIAGTAMAKVRSLKDSDGNSLQTVPPGYSAEIDGWRDLPPAGEQVLGAETEKKAKEAIGVREDELAMKKMEEDSVVIEQKREEHQSEYKEILITKRKLGRYKVRREGPRKPEISQDDDGMPSLNIVLKGDVDGTLEALLDTLDTYDSPDCKMDLVHYGVGSITPSDIELAQLFKGIIYAFNVQCPENIRTLAEESNVSIKHFNVIYKLIDDVKNEINTRLPAKQVEEVLGEASVLQQFEISKGKKKIPVAGCRCTKGLIKRNVMYKLVRNGEIIFTGSLSSMRHLKNEVDVIKLDTECGLQLSDTAVTFEQGDTLICFENKLEAQKTDWDPGF